MVNNKRHNYYLLYLSNYWIHIKRKKIFKPQFKIASIFIMVIGIIQITSASDSYKNLNRISITEDFIKKTTQQ